MKIIAATTSYRPTLTDPVTGKKKRFSFPLYGSLKEKKQQVKEIELFIHQCKLKAKKLEAEALILEAEACRRAKHLLDVNLILNVKESRNKQRFTELSEWIEKYKRSDSCCALSVSSSYTYIKRIVKFINYLKEKEINDIEVVNAETAESFLIDLNCRKASTYNKYLTVMASFYKGIKKENPFKDIKRKNAEEDVTTKTPFTEQEIELILSQFTGDWHDICLIASLTGMRFGDIVHLNKTNIIESGESQGHVIKLIPSKTSHTGRALYIQLLEPLYFLLNKLTDKRGYYFPDKVEKYKAGTKHAGSSLNHMFIKKLKVIGIQDKTFHCFRHYFVDKLRKAGLSNEQIGSIVGHSSVKQTRDYGDYHKPVDLSNIL